MNPPQIQPHWDAETRELTVNGVLVKAYRQPAPYQECILTVYQEDDWNRHIDDPLPFEADKNRRHARLRDTVHSLNQQVVKLIHFRLDGRGEGVIWDWVAGAPPDQAAVGTGEESTEGQQRVNTEELADPDPR